VEIEASDGLRLVGSYYALAGESAGAPAVLLMHHGGAQKEVWIDFIPLLVEAGYVTLTVDLRGHGETGGEMTAEQGIADIHTWLAWLRDQPGVDPARVSIVGASTGADLGLLAMAEDEQLVTLVGMSVLPEVMGAQTAPAVGRLASARCI
jgi:dipeptidyl aminopeptidase/acylaminoacyl peptidase